MSIPSGPPPPPPKIARGLRDAVMKMSRATEHMHSLNAAMHRWLIGGGYATIKDFDSETQKYVIRIHYGAVPVEWSLLVGEIVQAQRSALDCTVYGLSEQAVGRPLTEDEAGACEFPIFGPKPISAKALRGIALLPDAAQEFIKEKQPHKTANYSMTALWVLHALSNWDKHRLLHAVLVSSAGFRTTGGTLSYFSCIPPGVPIEDGAVLYEYILGWDSEGDVNIDTSFEIVFDEPARGRPVAATVQQLHAAVANIMKSLSGMVPE